MLKHHKRPADIISIIFVYMFTVISVFALAAILWHIISRGLPHISLGFLTQEPEDMGRKGGIFSIIIGTFWLALLSILISTPLGVFAAIHLTEYAKEGIIVRIIRFGTESLSGIPSIIFGLFGYVLFVSKTSILSRLTFGLYKPGWHLLAGALTLSIMVLPTLIRTSEESIKSVPLAYREGSLALGATRLQTIYKVVIPAAVPGILTGIILSIGRAVGETAAVFLTAGSSLNLPKSIFEPVRTMAVHVFMLAYEGWSEDNAYATATVLIIFILIINFTANKLIGRFSKAYK